MAPAAVVSVEKLVPSVRSSQPGGHNPCISEGVLRFAQMQAAGSSDLELSLVPESLPHPS